MKHLPSHTFFGKEKLFLKRYGIRFLVMGFWLSTVIILVNSWSQHRESEPMTTACIVKTNIKKGEFLQLNQIGAKQVLARDISSNAINDCNNTQLTQLPVLLDLQTGDILQLSVFKKPEELVTIKEQLSEKHQLFYLPIKDLHAFPLPLESGQELTLLGKSKKSEEAEVLIDSVKVADVSITKTDDDQEQITGVGFAVDQQTSLTLTKALADGWFLVAVTK